MSAVLNLKIVCDGCGATLSEVLAARASANGFAHSYGKCHRNLASRNGLEFKRAYKATLHYCDQCADRKTGKKVSLVFGV